MVNSNDCACTNVMNGGDGGGIGAAGKGESSDNVDDNSDVISDPCADWLPPALRIPLMKSRGLASDLDALWRGVDALVELLGMENHLVHRHRGDKLQPYVCAGSREVGHVARQLA